MRLAVIKSLRTHALLLAIIGLYCVSIVLLGYVYNAPDRVRLSLYSQALYTVNLCLGTLYVCGRVVWMLARDVPTHPVPAALLDLRRFLWPDRILAALPVFVCLPLFFSAFTCSKTLIPVIQPFAWDAAFAKWDEILHGGQPWRLLHPLLGHPMVTVFLSWIYATWFLVFYGVMFWQTFSMRPVRMQFLLSFVLAWAILGTAGAMLFSSAGPCFYDKVVDGPNPYAPLMEHLRRMDSWTATTQNQLWESLSNEPEMIGGISAMPCMHVSMVLLFALAAWRANRAASILLWLFAVLTAVACAYLGWHYVIDVYAAAVGTFAIWWGVGFLLRKTDHVFCCEN